MAAPHRTHDGSHPKWRADRPPGNGSCLHRESPQKRACDGKEDQLYTTGSAPWFAVIVDSEGCSSRQQSITERTIQRRDSTLSVPLSHSLIRAAGTHTKRTWRDNLQRSAQISSMGMDVMRPKRDNNRHTAGADPEQNSAPHDTLGKT